MPELKDGEWHGVAVVFDGKASHLYVDAEHIESGGKSVGIWVESGEDASVKLRSALGKDE